MPRGLAQARRGQGQLVYTPPTQARAVRAARVARGESLSFPCPASARYPAGSPTCPSAGRPGASQTGAGLGVGRWNPVIGLWLGGWFPGRPGVGRAIPEKVCRAGLGEQRAGGWTRHVCGLVCDSIPFTRRFKGRTASLARKRKNLGAGEARAHFGPAPRARRGPLAPGARSGFIRALDAGYSPGTSTQGARFTIPTPQQAFGLAMSGGRAAT